MSSAHELSNTISALFSLQRDQFQRDVHLPLAELLVASFHRNTPSFVSLADLLTFESDFLELDLPKEGVGLYTLRHQGKLGGAAYLGFHPKLLFTHWKSEVLSFPWEETSHLEIAYEKEKVIGLRRYISSPSFVQVGPWSISYSFQREEWRYVV